MDKSIILNHNKLIKLECPKERTMEELSKILNFDESLLRCWNNWFEFDGDWYYFKMFPHEKYLINELMGEQLAKYFDIKTVHYNIASYEDPYDYLSSKILYGIISKNFRVPNMKYYTTHDFNIKEDCDGVYQLYNHKLKRIFQDENNYQIVMNELLKMVILDFYMNQIDRRAWNFYFSKDKNGYMDLCPLFDYEFSFEGHNSTYKNAIFTVNFSSLKERRFIRENTTMQEQLYKLLDLNIEKIIEILKEEYEIRIPNSIEENYLYNDKIMKSKVKEYKLIK